jgi:microcystin-dependent protein
MSYNVNFTNSTLHPEPLVVQDNTTNQDTSLSFPGRNQVGYAKIISEDLLHLLENFASDSAPDVAKAVTGQLWYDSGNNKLFVFDGISWKSTSNIQTAVNEPSGATIGDLWVNASTQQLYLWAGTSWVLVGPQYSSGTKTGPQVESLFDIDNNPRSVVVMYTDDIPVAIISKDTFTPKVTIQGFTSIQTGVNLTTRTDISSTTVSPRFVGTATSADSLLYGTTIVPATSFVRTDTIQTVQAQFNVRDDAGIYVGANGNLNISVTSANAVIYNATPGASIDIQPSRTGSFGVGTPIVRVVENRVGINNLNPTKQLDLVGDFNLVGTITNGSEIDATNLDSGSIQTLGGMAVKKNIWVGGDVEIQNGTLRTKSIKPRTASETIGEATNRYATIYARNVVADTITGTVSGNIDGNSNSATSLRSATNFKLEGDVSSNVVAFNGTGNLNKVFTTTLTSDIISNKASVGNYQVNDEMLIYRAGQGLRKITRDTFLGDANVPIGTILAFAGPVCPTGYLFCDGSEVEEYRYRDLAAVVGTIYNGTTPLLGSPKGNTFRLPDLRGRLVLGKQDMYNALTVPYPGGTSSPSAGGGALVTPLVNDSKASVLGGTSGKDQYVIEPYNIPDHDHDLKGRRADNQTSGSQFYVINENTSVPTDFGPTTLIGGSGQANSRIKAGTVIGGGQAMASTGLVRIANEDKRVSGLVDSQIGRPFNVMNPFMTMNYIIRSGRPSNDGTQ